MSNNQRGLKFWVGAWSPVVFMALAILISSTPAFGADHTSGPLYWLWRSLFGPLTHQQWGFVHLCIRKTGHFTGYGLLGLTWLRAWWLTFPHSRFLADALLALLGTALIASSDEFHQTFLANRRGSPWDVLLDCCGALVMCLVAYAILRLSRPQKLHRAA